MSFTKKTVIILILITLIRELGVFDFSWFKSSDRIVSEIGLLDLKQFKNVSDVFVVNEFGEETHYNIQEGNHLLKLTALDRFSDWSFLHVLPLAKHDNSEHRIYYKVENNHTDHGWNRWAIVIGKQVKVESQVFGICSSHKYREDVIKKIQKIGQNSFDFLKKEQ